MPSIYAALYILYIQISPYQAWIGHLAYWLFTQWARSWWAGVCCCHLFVPEADITIYINTGNLLLRDG